MNISLTYVLDSVDQNLSVGNLIVYFKAIDSSGGMKMTEQTTKNSEQMNDANPQTIDQVRELLFGNEQRGLKSRIDVLEKELETTKANLKAELTRLENESIKRADAERQTSNRLIESIGSLLESVGRDISKVAR